MTGSPPIRRVRDGAEIEALCEPYQPLALFVSSPVNEASALLRAQSWVVGAPGNELGAVTVVALRDDLVSASAVLFDPEGARPIADLVRRTRSSRLAGGAAHVGPVADLIPGSSAFPLDLLGIRHDALAATRAADPERDAWRGHARVAIPGDLQRLVTLYREFPLEFFGPDDLEVALRRLIQEHRILVASIDGVIVGAQRVEAQSRRWNMQGGVSVLPDYRRRGVSRWLERCGQHRAEAEGRGNVGVVAPTNHVPYAGDAMIQEPWLEVRVPVDPTFAARGKRWARRQVRNRWPSAARSGR